MIRKLMWLACASYLLLLYSAAQAETQEQIRQCSEDVNCQEGAYCDLDAHFCRKCLNCETFKRKPPDTPSTCIKSITECGSCVEGDDIRAECVESIGNAGDNSSSAYVWLAVVIAIILLGLIIYIVVYAVRNLGTLKIRAFASASVQQPHQQFVATAPEFPPPYAARGVSPQPADSAYAPAPIYPYSDPYMPPDDSRRPFIRRDSKDRIPGAVESDGNQEAMPYSCPRYVRPPRYDHDEPSPPNEHLAEISGFIDTRDSNDNPTSVSNPANTSTSGSESVTGTDALALATNRCANVSDSDIRSASGSDKSITGSDALSLATNRWRQQDSNNNGAEGGASAANTQTVVINFTQSLYTQHQH